MCSDTFSEHFDFKLSFHSADVHGCSAQPCDRCLVAVPLFFCLPSISCRSQPSALVDYPPVTRHYNFLAWWRTRARDHRQSCSDYQLENSSVDLREPQRTERLVLGCLLLPARIACLGSICDLCGLARASCWSGDAKTWQSADLINRLQAEASSHTSHYQGG